MYIVGFKTNLIALWYFTDHNIQKRVHVLRLYKYIIKETAKRPVRNVIAKHLNLLQVKYESANTKAVCYNYTKILFKNTEISTFLWFFSAK